MSTKNLGKIGNNEDMIVEDGKPLLKSGWDSGGIHSIKSVAISKPKPKTQLFSVIGQGSDGKETIRILNLNSSLVDWLEHRGKFTNDDDKRITVNGIKLYIDTFRHMQVGIHGIDYTVAKVEGSGAYHDIFLKILKSKKLLEFRKGIENSYRYDDRHVVHPHFRKEKGESFEETINRGVTVSTVRDFVLPLDIFKNALGIGNTIAYQTGGWKLIVSQYAASQGFTGEFLKGATNLLVVNSCVTIAQMLMNRLEVIGRG